VTIRCLLNYDGYNQITVEVCMYGDYVLRLKTAIGYTHYSNDQSYMPGDKIALSLYNDKIVLSRFDDELVNVKYRYNSVDTNYAFYHTSYNPAGTVFVTMPIRSTISLVIDTGTNGTPLARDYTLKNFIVSSPGFNDKTLSTQFYNPTSSVIQKSDNTIVTSFNADAMVSYDQYLPTNSFKLSWNAYNSGAISDIYGLNVGLEDNSGHRQYFKCYNDGGMKIQKNGLDTVYDVDNLDALSITYDADTNAIAWVAGTNSISDTSNSTFTSEVHAFAARDISGSVGVVTEMKSLVFSHLSGPKGIVNLASEIAELEEVTVQQLIQGGMTRYNIAYDYTDVSTPVLTITFEPDKLYKIHIDAIFDSSGHDVFAYFTYDGLYRYDGSEISILSTTGFEISSNAEDSPVNTIIIHTESDNMLIKIAGTHDLGSAGTCNVDITCQKC
jgi:hypothetical protein